MPDPRESYDEDFDPLDLVDEMEHDELGQLAPTAPGQTTGDSTFPCPYCGEENDLFLEPDPDRPLQEYAEECEACGRTYAVTVEYDDLGEPSIHAERME